MTPLSSSWPPIFPFSFSQFLHPLLRLLLILPPTTKIKFRSKKQKNLRTKTNKSIFWQQQCLLIHPDLLQSKNQKLKSQQVCKGDSPSCNHKTGVSTGTKSDGVKGVLKYVLASWGWGLVGGLRSSHKPKLSAAWQNGSVKWIPCQGRHQYGEMLPWR